MFKKLLIGTLAAVIVVAAGASVYTALASPAATESQTAPAAESIPFEPVAVNGADAFAGAGTAAQPVTTAAPTADDTAGLLYMYEEEKLARDVYNALYGLWGQATFQNIAASEQAHMDAVGALLSGYGIALPGTSAGVFNDPSLQALYNDLMAAGSLSLADALRVGATIEEVDIMDLQSRLALTTNADIQLVYGNLMNGSFNHLRNFVGALERQTGEVYQPQYLSADLYQSIMASANGNGQGNNNGAAPTGRGRGAGAGAGVTTNTDGGNGKGYRGGRQ